MNPDFSISLVLKTDSFTVKVLWDKEYCFQDVHEYANRLQTDLGVEDKLCMCCRRLQEYGSWM